MHSRQRKRVAALALSLTLILLLLLAESFGAFTRLEWISYDQRMQLFNHDKPLHDAIAVVLIDEASLQALDPLVGRWPWPRSVHADLIDFFTMGGARAIIVDILFSESEIGKREGTQSENDARLIDATAASGITIHAMQLMRENDPEIARDQLNQPLPADLLAPHSYPHATGFNDVGNNSYLLPIPELYRAAAGLGIVEIEPDADGIYRRLRLFSTYQGALLPTMAVAPYYAQTTPIQQIPGAIIAGNDRLPTDADGYSLINYAGEITPYSVSGIIDSIQKLRRGDVENLLTPPDLFADKLVFIGSSAIGLQDVKTTPLANRIPGVVLHASALSAILNHDLLTPAVAWRDRLLSALLVLLVTLTTLYLAEGRLYRLILLPLLIGGLYLGFALYAFSQQQVYAIAMPLGAVLSAALSAITYLTFSESLEKRRVRAMFASYVSPVVLKQLIEQPESQAATAVSSRETISVLFSDIRGFTTISENYSAERVVQLLNIYFAVMTETIFAHHGTLDKFIGDAIMAFWGAPIRTSDHADLAVTTAIKMMQALREVNRTLTDLGYNPIAIGIGINTDSVILGNIGSEKKLDYTVIGDGVNIASRLEGMTKYYGTPVLISENSLRALLKPIPVIPVDAVRVKGKQQPLRIFAPIISHESDTPESIAMQVKWAETGFDHYLQQRWQQAIDCYQQLDHPELAALFIGRCQNYLQHPPAAEWDGVYTATSK
ncbi:MAG: adenylate/guanylate cyclase domain-containing protein [Gammaproteobacteria bacterium]|nr:adenylate/guanylate cyclase domain-containing protein [Gammaproteobacteria bacterium]